MLSPGVWYKDVPKDPIENLRFRLWIRQRCRESEAVRKMILHVCKHDIIFFLNVFACQFNPKPVGKFTPEIGPFITWDFQDAALLSNDPDEPGILWCIEHGESMVIEKSRDMGASWLCLLVMLWLMLFHDWKQFTVVSKDADAVDKKESKDSLFWKLDFVLGFLPPWLKGKVTRLNFLIKSERTNSSIVGTASTGTASVGGRATAMFLDEYSLIREARELFDRTKDTTNCRIFNGTHYGTSGMFAELCDPQSDTGKAIKKLQLHWSKHPDKKRGLYRWNPHTNRTETLDPMYPYPHDFEFVTDGMPAGGPFPGLRSPWYDKECVNRSNKRAVALHLDMDPKGSSNQFFDAVVINALRREFSRPAIGRYDIRYDPETGFPMKGGQLGSFVSTPTGHLHLWCELDYQGRPPPENYAIGGDIASGSGATPSVFSIFNFRGEKVGQYFNARIEPTPLAPLVVALCWLFADSEGIGARLVWEMNGPGVKFSERVIGIGYRNVHYRLVNPFGLSKGMSDMPGWYPSKALKRDLLEDYRHALQNRIILNPCDTSMATCLDYVWKGDAVDHDRKDANPDESGARENHGDEVMADALAYMLVKDRLVKPGQEKEKKAAPYSRQWLKEYREMHAPAVGVWE